mgnify:FL=1
MTLNLEVFDYHLVVSDDCSHDTLESCIVNDEFLKIFDEECRNSNPQRERNFLLYRNIILLKPNYLGERDLELICPTCDEHYVIGKKELSFLKEYYDERPYWFFLNLSIFRYSTAKNPTPANNIIGIHSKIEIGANLNKTFSGE